MTKRTVRYPPALARPMPPLDLKSPIVTTGMFAEPGADAHNARVMEEHNGSPAPNGFVERLLRGWKLVGRLAYRLALQVVPGLRVAKGKAGRKRVQDPLEDARLKLEIVAMMAANIRLSLSKAFKDAAKKRPGKSAAVIKATYYRARIGR